MVIKNGVLTKVHKWDISINGKFIVPNDVKIIGSSAFQNCEKLKRIKFHDKIDSIGDFAFEGCTSLREVNIPDSVKNMGPGVFRDCISLVSAKLPKGLQTIEKDTFAGCTKLKDVGPLDEVLKIKNGAFCECSSLETLFIPKCEELGENAFYNCMSLKNLSLSKDFRCLDSSAFRGCQNLALDIDTSLFYCKNKFFLLDFCRKLTINGFYFEIGFFDGTVSNMQVKELKDKIDNYLKEHNITEERCFSLEEHISFIAMVCDNLNNNDLPYDYRKNFNNYMERYISKYKSSEEPEIITFDDEEPSNRLNAKVEQTLSVNVTNNNIQNNDSPISQNINNIKSSIVGETIKNKTVRKVENINPLENYDFNDINAYANKLGLTSWVDKLKQRISLCLLAINAPKECFKNIGITHVAFIREMLQCLSEDSNYDYKSAVDNYIKNYIETHKLQNVGNEKLNSSIDNQEIDPSKIENLTSENYRLKQRVAELEQELLMRKNQENEVSNNSVRKK